jgi:hypothetical protein
VTPDHCPDASRELRSCLAELSARLLDPKGSERNDPVELLRLRLEFERLWEPYAVQLVAAARKKGRTEGSWPMLAEALGMTRESAWRKYGRRIEEDA